MGFPAKLLFLWLFLVFVVGLGLRFLPRGQDPQALQDSLLFPERLAVIAKFSEDLSPELQSQLLEAAIQLEQNPVKKAVLEGQKVSGEELESLPETYRHIALYQQQSSGQQDELESLRALAAEARSRLTLCVALLGAVVFTALGLSFLGKSQQKRSPLPMSAHGPVAVLTLFMLWDVLNLFGLGALIETLGLAKMLPPLLFAMLAQLAGYALLIGLLVSARSQEGSWNLSFPFPSAWIGRGYFACYALVLSANLLIARLTGESPTSSNPLLGMFMEASPWQVGLLAVMVVLVGPAMEELLFRGWLLGGLRQAWGDRRALLITSALFAMIHGDLWATPALFLLGCVFGWVYLRTGSLYVSIALHSMWNGTTFIFLLANMP